MTDIIQKVKNLSIGFRSKKGDEILILKNISTNIKKGETVGIVGIIMLSESVLGPIWAFLFVSERPSLFGLIGGAIILFAVLIQFYSLLVKSKKSISH